MLAEQMRIFLGYEVTEGEAQAVSMPVHHMMVTGMTRLSGKTTTIEALLSRLPKEYSALVFRTKRGEIDFPGARRVQPYYRPSLDWEYVESLLEAAMKQRLKFERSWIIRASRGAETLRQVYENIKAALEDSRLRGIDQSVYTNLQAYFEKILPQLEERPFAERLLLEPGANVMELGELSEEVQALVISSCLEEIYLHREKTVIVIPEAWQFLPQSRGNPVKWSAQHVIRQGGANEVYLWLDSQDVTTVTKDVLKPVGVWLLGRQQEVNEVRRVIDQLPTREKPKPDEIMTLPVGHFFVATEDWCKKVYVQPAWSDDAAARAVAAGNQSVLAVQSERPAPKSSQEAMAEGGLEGLLGGMDGLVEELDHAKRDKEEAAIALARAEAEGDALREEIQELKEKLEAAAGQMGQLTQDLGFFLRFQELLREIMGVGPAAPQLTDQLVDAVAAKVAYQLGMQSVKVVAPLEGLKARYQEEAVARLSREIEGLDTTQRRSLEWLLAVGKSSTFREVAVGLGLPISGNGYVRFSQGVKGLVSGEWVSQDSHGLKAVVRQKVEKTLAPYTSDAGEMELTFNHLVARLSREGKGAV